MNSGGGSISRRKTIKRWFCLDFSVTFQPALVACRSRTQPTLHKTHESISALQPSALPRLGQDGSAVNFSLHCRARLRQFSWVAYADRKVAKANPEGQAPHN